MLLSSMGGVLLSPGSGKFIGIVRYITFFMLNILINVKKDDLSFLQKMLNF